MQSKSSFQHGSNSSSGATSRPALQVWRPVRSTCLASFSEPIREPEELFAELDGADLRIGDRVWHVEVFSVLDDEAGRWIQLGLSGPFKELTTLQLPSGAGVTHVSLALNAWFEDRNVPDLS